MVIRIDAADRRHARELHQRNPLHAIAAIVASCVDAIGPFRRYGARQVRSSNLDVSVSELIRP